MKRSLHLRFLSGSSRLVITVVWRVVTQVIAQSLVSAFFRWHHCKIRRTTIRRFNEAIAIRTQERDCDVNRKCGAVTSWCWMTLVYSKEGKGEQRVYRMSQILESLLPRKESLNKRQQYIKNSLMAGYIYFYPFLWLVNAECVQPPIVFIMIKH